MSEQWRLLNLTGSLPCLSFIYIGRNLPLIVRAFSAPVAIFVVVFAAMSLLNPATYSSPYVGDWVPAWIFFFVSALTSFLPIFYVTALAKIGRHVFNGE